MSSPSPSPPPAHPSTFCSKVGNVLSTLVPINNINAYRKTSLYHVRGKDLTGKIIIVTGAAGALGKSMTQALSSAGATVIACDLSLDALEIVKADILKEKKGDGTVKQGPIECMPFNLGDYDSIAAFVQEFKAKFNKVDVLINNAAMSPSLSGYKEGKYGLEITFQVNLVGTIVLTESILPLLADDGRVVSVSSLVHTMVKDPFEWEGVPSTAENAKGFAKEYAEAKWLLTVYCTFLAKRLAKQADLTKQTQKSIIADPGVAPDSELWDHQPMVFRMMIRTIFRFVTKRSDQAAACGTFLGAAESDGLVNGGYYHSGKLYPHMRKDTEKVENWEKTADLLIKVLPDNLKFLIQK